MKNGVLNGVEHLPNLADDDDDGRSGETVTEVGSFVRHSNGNGRNSKKSGGKGKLKIQAPKSVNQVRGGAESI